MTAPVEGWNKARHSTTTTGGAIVSGMIRNTWYTVDPRWMVRSAMATRMLSAITRNVVTTAYSSVTKIALGSRGFVKT